MPVTSVADLTIEALRASSIDTLFCLPGVQNDDFFDALVDARDIRPIVTRHEQGAAYMAMGAAQATGQPAAFCVVPGPGMLNASGALTSAYWANTRVLALIGAIPTAWKGRNTGILHDLPDPTAILSQLTKHADYVPSGSDAVRIWQRVLDELVSGEPHPVSVEVPVDVWSHDVDGVLESPAASMPNIDLDQLDRVSQILGRAERPLIMVGSGAYEASQSVTALAELLQAPVFARRMGHGVVDTRHPLHAYLPMGRELWADADVVVGIGTRMEFPNFQWGTDDDLTIVQINIDADELDRYRTGVIGLHGDADEACRLLLEAVPTHNRNRTDRTAEMADRRARYWDTIAYLEPQISYLTAIRDVLPDDGVIVEDVTQIGFAAHLAYEHRQPRTFLSTGPAGTLGAGVAHGIGAAAALGDRPQVTITGDGGMLFTATELATAVQHDIPTNVLLFDNNAYGNVRRIQSERFGPDRTIASTLRNPEWIAFGESMGVATEKVHDPDELRPALERAFAHGGPSLIVVPISDEPNPWPLMRTSPVRGPGA